MMLAQFCKGSLVLLLLYYLHRLGGVIIVGIALPGALLCPLLSLPCLGAIRFLCYILLLRSNILLWQIFRLKRHFLIDLGLGILLFIFLIGEACSPSISPLELLHLLLISLPVIRSSVQEDLSLLITDFLPLLGDELGQLG
jgi:hypothetical protein